MPDLNSYQRHAHFDADNGVWIGYINEFPEIETIGASSADAIGQLDNALANLIEQYGEEGWTVPIPGAAAPSLMPVWGISMIIMFLMTVVAVTVMAARCGWMPGGW